MALTTALERDMISMRQAIARLSSIKLGPTSSPVFGNASITTDLAVGNDLTVGGSFVLTGTLTLSSLTASRLIATNASKELVSSNLNSWVSGTTNEIDIADDGDGTITIGIVNPLIVGKGGTGAATFTDHSILLGSGTDAFTALGAATNGQLPIGSTGNDPVLATLISGDGISITNGAGSITVASTSDGTFSSLDGGSSSSLGTDTLIFCSGYSTLL